MFDEVPRDRFATERNKAVFQRLNLQAANTKDGNRSGLVLLVCTWRQGDHVGGQEQKHFSPLGTKLYFHVNSSWKNYIVMTPNMAALSRGCKPRAKINKINTHRKIFPVFPITFSQISRWDSNHTGLLCPRRTSNARLALSISRDNSTF